MTKLKAINGFVVRWRQQSDLNAFLEINTLTSEYLWDRQDFISLFRAKNTHCYVATRWGRAVGFVVFELSRRKINVLNLSVHPDYKFQGVGRMLLDKVKAKLERKYFGISCDVRESNLAAHLFLHSCGFRAVKIVYDYFLDFHGDGQAEKEHAYSFFLSNPAFPNFQKTSFKKEWSE